MVLRLYMFFYIYLYLFLIFFFLYFFLGGGVSLDLYLFSQLGTEVSFSFLFDSISIGFFSCVSLISGLVFYYSIFYMEGSMDLRRFSILVFMFVVSMFLLVFSGNFFTIMLGWDGLGVVSFCLVIFYSNSYSLESGLVTVFSNRVGDVFFICSFFFFWGGGNFFVELSSNRWDNLFFLFIFLGAITKSAQVPFSAWLPAAMAAPTPVSSLVHSSTLVTAGVYVLVRFNYMFTFFKSSFLSILFIFTMLVGGFVASIEKDLKKVVAMSTLSQLGMMTFILSVGGWHLSFLHVVVHALFKSMLFLSTGSLMSQSMGIQDSRFYGSHFLSYNSFLYFCVSGLCLSGFPFFIGFYSKDYIISFNSLSSGIFLYYSFIVGCIFTVLYSIRLVNEGYLLMLKYSCYSSYNESLSFFIPVSLLFLKCWSVGGLFYIFSLSSSTQSFSLFDLMYGSILLLLGSITYFFIMFSYSLLYNFSNIIFFRWATTSSSFLFRRTSYHLHDYTWLEYFGGSKVFSLLSEFNKFFVFYSKVTLGWLLMGVLAFYFFVL